MVELLSVLLSEAADLESAVETAIVAGAFGLLASDDAWQPMYVIYIYILSFKSVN